MSQFRVKSTSSWIKCCLQGSSVHGILQIEVLEWVAFPSPGDLPNPEIEPRSPALQADSLPFEPELNERRENHIVSITTLGWGNLVGFSS